MVNIRVDKALKTLVMATSLGEGKSLNSNLWNSAEKLILCRILLVQKGLFMYLEKTPPDSVAIRQIKKLTNLFYDNNWKKSVGREFSKSRQSQIWNFNRANWFNIIQLRADVLPLQQVTGQNWLQLVKKKKKKKKMQTFYSVEKLARIFVK